MTLPAVRVNSIRPKANYLSGTLHFCSPCFFLFLVVVSFPPSLHVTNQSVYLSTGCTSWECSLKQIQCPPLADSCLSYSVRKKNSPFLQFVLKKRTWSFTKGHRWSSGLLSYLSFFFFYHSPFFRKLICTKTSILPSSGLKAMLVGHQVWFSTSDNFLRGGVGPKLDPLAARSTSKLALGNTILRCTPSSLPSFPERFATNPKKGGIRDDSGSDAQYHCAQMWTITWKIIAMKGVRRQPVSRPIGVTGVCCCALLVLLAITVVSWQDVSLRPLPEALLWSHSRRAYDASLPLTVHSPTPQPKGPD